MSIRLIVGCGYVGLRVAKNWLGSETPCAPTQTVFAITRTPRRVPELEAVGIRPIVWDWLDTTRSIAPQVNWELFQQLATSSETHDQLSRTILVSVSHSAQPGIPASETHTRGLDHLLSQTNTQFFDRFQWIYLSTTGVYGDTESGAWVDEHIVPIPNRPGSIAAYSAEQWLQKNIVHEHRVVLRPAGIYGPERVPRWQSIQDQVPLEADPNSYLNLIHVDDLAAIIDKVANRKMQHSVYCVSDCEPSLRKDYYNFIAALGNWPAPVFQPAKPVSSTIRSRSDGNKRISNQRILKELQYAFLYPTYREGLQSLFAT
jgi:nucleoside-diphosphate-sugar epimerase